MSNSDDRHVHEGLDAAAAGIVNPRAAENAMQAFWRISAVFFDHHLKVEMQKHDDAREARNEAVAKCANRLQWSVQQAPILLMKFDAARAEMKDEMTVGACLLRLVAEGTPVEEVSEILRALQFRARRRAEDDVLSGESEAKEKNRLIAEGVRIGSRPFTLQRGDRVAAWIGRSIGTRGEMGRIYRLHRKHVHVEADIAQEMFDLPEEGSARIEQVQTVRNVLAVRPAAQRKRKERFAVCGAFGIGMSFSTGQAQAISAHVRWIRSLAEDSGLHPHDVKQIRRRAAKAAKSAKYGEGLPTKTIAMLLGISEGYARKLIRQGLTAYAAELANVPPRGGRMRVRRSSSVSISTQDRRRPLQPSDPRDGRRVRKRAA